MELKERIEAISSEFNLNRTQLSRRIGVNPQKLHDIARGQTKQIPSDVLSGVIREFPTVSQDWLLTGEGEMLVSEGTTVTGNGNAVNTITGNGNKVSASVAGDFADLAGKIATSLQIAPNQLTSSQSQLAKSQEQMDRLIALLEKQQAFIDEYRHD